MRSVMDTSDPQDEGTVLPPAGYSAVVTDKNYSCKIGVIEIRAFFRVRPPQATGMCGAITQTYIESMAINGSPVFDLPVSFNLRCLNDIDLYSIDVYSLNGEMKIKTCYASWDWGIGYTVSKCEEVPRRGAPPPSRSPGTRR